LSFPFNVHHAESLLLQGGVFCGRERALPAQALRPRSNPMPILMPKLARRSGFQFFLYSVFFAL